MTKFTNGEAMPETEIRRWLRLYRGLNELADTCGEMNQDALDRIIEAASFVARDIIDAPATNPSDVADKFRLVAEFVDDKSGSSTHEDAAVANAVASLDAMNVRDRDNAQRNIAEYLASHAAPATEAAE